MKHYTDEKIKLAGFTLTPVTDVIHKTKEGWYTNLVSDEEGDQFLAFYTKKDQENDFWRQPFKVERV